MGGVYIRRGLPTEGNLRFKIDWASLQWEGNLPFCFVLLCIRGQIPSTSLPGWGVGAYIRRGGLTEGFLSYDFGGLIFCRGLYLEGLIFAILLYVVKSSPNKVFVYFCIKNELQCVYNM